MYRSLLLVWTNWYERRPAECDIIDNNGCKNYTFNTISGDYQCFEIQNS